MDTDPSIYNNPDHKTSNPNYMHTDPSIYNNPDHNYHQNTVSPYHNTYNHINISPDHITSASTNTSHQINLKIKQSNG